MYTGGNRTVVKVCVRRRITISREAIIALRISTITTHIHTFMSKDMWVNMYLFIILLPSNFTNVTATQ